jgi:nucleoside-diphosphate-sugar epimerase
MPRYWLVPVVVTAAETSLGRRVVARLRAEGAEVRAVVGKAVSDLGVPTSKADWDDAERLGAVMEDAHTVIHLAGAKRVRALLEAMEGTSVVRIVSTVPVEWRAAPADGAHEVVVIPLPRWRPDLDAVADAIVEADRRE